MGRDYIRIQDSVPFAKGFLAGRGIPAACSSTWFPTGMHLHVVPLDDQHVAACELALRDILGLLSGWTGEVMPVGWRREVK